MEPVSLAIGGAVLLGKIAWTTRCRRKEARRKQEDLRKATKDGIRAGTEEGLGLGVISAVGWQLKDGKWKDEMPNEIPTDGEVASVAESVLDTVTNLLA